MTKKKTIKKKTKSNNKSTIKNACPKCQAVMSHVTQYKQNEIVKQYWQCPECKYEKLDKNFASKPANKLMSNKRTPKTNIDRQDPIRKFVIPKFRDTFYHVSSDTVSSTYYNPIQNILRIEGKVEDNIKKNSLLSLLTAKLVGLDTGNK